VQRNFGRKKKSEFENEKNLKKSHYKNSNSTTSCAIFEKIGGIRIRKKILLHFF